MQAIANAKKELDDYRTKMAPEVAKQDAARKAAIAKAQEAAKKVADTAVTKQPQWEQYVDLSTEWVPLDLEVVRATGVQTLAKQADGSLLATPLPAGQMAIGNYQLRAKTTLSGITAIKLEALPDVRLPSNGPGLATDGNFVLSEFVVQQAALDAKRAKKGEGVVTLKTAIADFSQDNFPVTESLKKGNRDRGWAVSPEAGYRHEAVFYPDAPIGGEGGVQLSFQMVQGFQNGKYNLGRFRIWVTTQPMARFGTPKAVAEAIRTPVAKRTPEQKKLLNEAFIAQFREYNAAQKAVANASRPLPVDAQLVALELKHTEAQRPIMLDGKLIQLRRDVELSKAQLASKRLTSAQDLAWALINSPAFLFNH